MNIPDRSMIKCAGPCKGRRCKRTFFVTSNVGVELLEVLGMRCIRYGTYGNGRYRRKWLIGMPFQNYSVNVSSKAFNEEFSRVRVAAEWLFREVKFWFTTLDCKPKIWTRRQPTGSLYLASMMLSNLTNCLYLNTVLQYF